MSTELTCASGPNISTIDVTPQSYGIYHNKYGYNNNYLGGGYTCANCGLWASYGFAHYCQPHVYIQPTVTVVPDLGAHDKLDRIADLLEQLVALMAPENPEDLTHKEYEKVCRCDGEGCEDCSPNPRGSRATSPFSVAEAVRKLQVELLGSE